MTDRPIKQLNVLATELLLAIESRGRDATGYVAIDDDGSVQLEKAAMQASDFIFKKRRLRHDTRTVLLHTRFATTGDRRSVADAHPQSCGSVYCTHNGTVSNAEALFREWDLPRRARVDSEVIPALVSEASGWSDIGGALELLEGSAAVALADADRPQEVALAVTRGFSIVYVEARDFIVWASTRRALLRAWRKAFGRRPKSERAQRLAAGQILRVRDGHAVIESFTAAPVRTILTLPNELAWDDEDDEDDPPHAWADGAGILLPSEERCDDCGGMTVMATYRWDSILCPDCYGLALDAFCDLTGSTA